MPQVAPVTAIVIILGLWAMVAVLSLFGTSIPLPAPWLTAWTELIIKVVAAAVGLHVLWKAPGQLQQILTRNANPRDAVK